MEKESVINKTLIFLLIISLLFPLVLAQNPLQDEIDKLEKVKDTFSDNETRSDILKQRWEEVFEKNECQCYQNGNNNNGGKCRVWRISDDNNHNIKTSEREIKCGFVIVPFPVFLLFVGVFLSVLLETLTQYGTF